MLLVTSQNLSQRTNKVSFTKILLMPSDNFLSKGKRCRRAYCLRGDTKFQPNEESRRQLVEWTSRFPSDKLLVRFRKNVSAPGLSFNLICRTGARSLKVSLIGSLKKIPSLYPFKMWIVYVRSLEPSILDNPIHVTLNLAPWNPATYLSWNRKPKTRKKSSYKNKLMKWF